MHTCMHICIYIYVCIYIVYIYVYTQTPGSSSHSTQKPDTVRQASSSPAHGKWQSFLLWACLSPDHQPEHCLLWAAVVAMWTRAEVSLWPRASPRACVSGWNVRLRWAEEPLHGMHACVSFCPGRRHQDPPISRSPVLAGNFPLKSKSADGYGSKGT